MSQQSNGNHAALGRVDHHDPGRIDENQQLIDAIRNYEVDALVVSGPDGESVVTLERALAHTQELLRQTREILRATFDQALVGVILCDREGLILENNAAADELAGSAERRGLLGRALLELVDPEDAGEVTVQVQEVWDGRVPCFEQEFRVRRLDGGRRWIKCSACGIRRRGELDGLLVLAEDVTARRHAQERQAMFVAELNHRVKNTMATIEAMAIQATQRAESMEHFRESFLGRMRALRDAHSMLSDESVVDADLRTVVETVIAPHREEAGDRVSIEGPYVPLRPRAAMTLSLALHELVTNAVKYGSLRTPGGHLRIAWELEAGDRPTLAIDWHERGEVPPASDQPLSGGFGVEFIRTSIEYELGGSTDLRLEQRGLHARIHFPLEPATSEG